MAPVTWLTFWAHLKLIFCLHARYSNFKKTMKIFTAISAWSVIFLGVAIVLTTLYTTRLYASGAEELPAVFKTPQPQILPVIQKESSAQGGDDFRVYFFERSLPQLFATPNFVKCLNMYACFMFALFFVISGYFIAKLGVSLLAIRAI